VRILILPIYWRFIRNYEDRSPSNEYFLGRFQTCWSI
jgi:hypothetical protein